MFLEKYSRFVRIYNLLLRPRHSTDATLPLHAAASSFSISDALNTKIKIEDAFEVAPNGDIIELVKAEYVAREKCLVLLFHRASPDAADPAYRRKIAAKTGSTISIRRATKDADEHQSVSAHLVIKDMNSPRGYPSALEEIPGLSMSSIRPIIIRALQDYPWTFKRKNKNIETYTTFRAEGVKSETLSRALERGEINFVKLSRPAAPDFVDADGAFEPTTETMRLRVKTEITGRNWRSKFDELLKGAKEAGWKDFSVDIDLEDKRHKTVKIEREAEAKEILFVRSEQISVAKELSPCTEKINPAVVKKLAELAK